MYVYVTQADVDTKKPDWSANATAVEIEQAVLKANVYLNSLALKHFDPVPAPVVIAGAELAVLALANNLFNQQSEKLTAKTVSADGTSVSKQYADAVDTSTPEMRYINALLSPYLPAGNYFRVTRG